MLNITKRNIATKFYQRSYITLTSVCYLSKEITKFIVIMGLSDSLSSASFRRLDHDRVTNVLCHLHSSARIVNTTFLIQFFANKFTCVHLQRMRIYINGYTFKKIQILKTKMQKPESFKTLQIILPTTTPLLWRRHYDVTFKRHSYDVTFTTSFLWWRHYLPEPLHFKVGMLRDWATMEDAILSPSAHIAPAGGPSRRRTSLFSLS